MVLMCGAPPTATEAAKVRRRAYVMYLVELGGLTTPRPTPITCFARMPPCTIILAAEMTGVAPVAPSSTRTPRRERPIARCSALPDSKELDPRRAAMVMVLNNRGKFGDGRARRGHMLYMIELGGPTTPRPAPITRFAGRSP